MCCSGDQLNAEARRVQRLNLGQDEFPPTHTLHQWKIPVDIINSSFLHRGSLASRLQSWNSFYIHLQTDQKIRDLYGEKLHGVSTLPWVIPCCCKTFSDVHRATGCILVLDVTPQPRCCDLKLTVQERDHSVKAAEKKNGVSQARNNRWIQLAAGWQMHDSSLQQEQTHCVHLYGSHLGALWELCLSMGVCHFLVGETSLLEQSLPGCLALKYWCIVGAGVYCGDWWAQRVLRLCAVPMIVREAVMHIHIHTHIHRNTHTSDLWIHSSPAGSCLCWFGIHRESSLSKTRVYMHP